MLWLKLAFDLMQLILSVIYIISPIDMIPEGDSSISSLNYDHTYSSSLLSTYVLFTNTLYPFLVSILWDYWFAGWCNHSPDFSSPCCCSLPIRSLFPSWWFCFLNLSQVACVTFSCYVLLQNYIKHKHCFHFGSRKYWISWVRKEKYI